MLKDLLLRKSVVILFILIARNDEVFGQTYPESYLDQSYIPASPNAMGFQTYGNDPVTLFEGLPAISIPIYQVKCGSLVLPITLSYNYNGLMPLQDAGWVGLGWNVNAGGVISRIIEGGIDNSENSGYNYGQYNLIDSLDRANGPALDSFLQKAYNNNLGYTGKSFDMAPDIYDAEFNGYSGKFFWINNKAYRLSYNKDLAISWASPTSNIIIKTTDGTQYTFGALESTTSYFYGGSDSTHSTFTSAWHLTQVVSADLKDTISLSYARYTWQQAVTPYQTSYTESAGSQPDLGSDPLTYLVSPTIQSEILQSISCRNSRVSFIPDQTLRTDVLGSYPRLKEIQVIDSLSQAVVKTSMFSYEYFGQTSSNPAAYERLALKRYNTINLQLANDSLTYTFKYNNEFSNFPLKGTSAIDYWGFSNAVGTSVGSIIPPPTSPFFTTTPPSNATYPYVNRNPNIIYSIYGVLDTIVYPEGGYTAFQYQANGFNGAYGIAGPGVCLQSSITYSNNPLSPPLSQKNYTYLLDDGVTCSGVLTNLPSFYDPPFVSVNTSSNNNYYVYKASNNSAGVASVNPKFYYQKVTESVISDGETHKTDHYFTAYPELYLDARETKRVDYVNTPATNIFMPIQKIVSSYGSNLDTSFYYAVPVMDSEYVNPLNTPKIRYSFFYNLGYWNTYWVYPVSQRTVQYDVNGDSLVKTVNFFFNGTTRNLAYTQLGTSDGQVITQKFKYPEDYTGTLTGNMVTAGVLSPVIESEIWMKPSANDSNLISGSITIYDQTIFKPISMYSIETTSPIASLNNQTSTNGLYTSILCDSRYILKGQIQYDSYGNPNVATKASDINLSYIWDYKRCQPIATVKNGSQADIAYTSFEADGSGNWSFTGIPTLNSGPAAPTGNSYYNLGQTNGSITKSGLTSTTTYVISYWTTSSSPLSITGTIAGYPIKGKTIGSWTYYEHKISGQTSVTISGSTNIDELRLYPANAQMTTCTFAPSVGVSSQCDADNRVTYYQYDGFGRLRVVLDQDHNVIKTVQYHTNGETAE